ncbi:MAG: hypothetical protein J5861_00340, partial [Desulfovibrio sp.]|nr:hypothetical protein [Desulfovibrio sp.]
TILALAKIGISKSFFPLAIHLSMNHQVTPARKVLIYPFRSLVKYFSRFSKKIADYKKLSPHKRESALSSLSKLLSIIFIFSAEISIFEALTGVHRNFLWDYTHSYHTPYSSLT